MKGTRESALAVLGLAGGPTFRRFGRTYHLDVRTADDLTHVLALDEAHWVATAAPIATLRADPKLLAWLDSDQDGFIRAGELRSAIEWLFDVLEDRSGITTQSRALRLGALRTDSEDARIIGASARKMLKRTLTPDDAVLELDEVRRIEASLDALGLGEAGIVPPSAGESAPVRVFLEDVLACVGGEPHPSGSPGVTEAHLDRFLEQGRRELAFRERGELREGESTSMLLPLGEGTAAAFEKLRSLAPKLDRYFTLCGAALLWPEAAERAWEEAFSGFDAASAAETDALLDRAPLARFGPRLELDFEGIVNPRDAAALEVFRDVVATPILGARPSKMTQGEYRRIAAAFAPYKEYLEQQPHPGFAALPTSRLRTCLESPAFEAEARSLLERSRESALVLAHVRLVEKLLLLQAHVIPFVNSFVSFPNLYDLKVRALFEMGMLIMDGRHFTMSVKVTDRAQHARFSDASNMFVLYVEVSSREGEVLYEVAVPVTSGGRGNLIVGKRGVFHDEGRVERHARVVHIVENPISLSEALVAPIKRLGKAITGQIEKMSTEAEAGLASGLTQTMTQPEKVLGAPAQRPTGVQTGSLIVGGGIALAAIGSSLAFIAKTVAGLPWWTIAGSVLGAALAVTAPLTIVAWFKLRRRDLSAILEGSGWAINARMRLTRAQALTFSRTPAYPPGSRGFVRSRAWLWLLLTLPLATAVYWLLR